MPVQTLLASWNKARGGSESRGHGRSWLSKIASKTNSTGIQGGVPSWVKTLPYKALYQSYHQLLIKKLFKKRERERGNFYSIDRFCG